MSKNLLKLIALFFIMGACEKKENKKPSIEYYARLSGIISPFLEYNPVSKISKEKALTTNHYRFYYDDTDKVSKIEFYQRDKKSDEAYYGSHAVKYEYSENKVVRTYYNKLDKPASLWRHYYFGDNIHKEVYTKNETSTTLKLYDVEDNQIESGLGTYTFKSTRLDDHRFTQYQFKKDGSSNVLTNYFPFEASIITTNENRALHKIINIDPKTKEKSFHEKSGFAEVIFSFDEYGNEEGWEFRDEKGQLANRSQQVEDPGYAKWVYDITWADQKAGIMRSFVEKYFNKNEKQVANMNGVFIVNNSFDDKGNFASYEFINEKGNKMVHPLSGFARTEIDRNAKGQRSEVRYFGADGKLMNQANKAAVQRYEYNDEGDLIKTILLDKNLKEVVSE